METIKERLLEELGAAIIAVYGDQADEEAPQDLREVVGEGELKAIMRKVAFYINL